MTISVKDSEGNVIFETEDIKALVSIKMNRVNDIAKVKEVNGNSKLYNNLDSIDIWSLL